MNVVELVREANKLLSAGAVPHAFGGAIALAYYAQPRGTQDADINIFLPQAEAESIVERFGALGLKPERPAAEWSPIAGVRLTSSTGPGQLDLYFSIDERYAVIAERVRTVSFGAAEVQIPILSAEDLVVFKLSYGRDKDWVDLRQMAASGMNLDLDYVEEMLIGLRGPTLHPRMARARTIFSA